MKQTAKALITALTLLFSASPISADDAPLSPGLQVIANSISVKKTGVAGANVNFSAEDFELGLDLESISKITVTSLPSRELGVLKLGALEVYSGQTISRKNLSSLRFVPTSRNTLETSFGFCVGSSPFNTEYTCKVYALDRINSAPIITQPDALKSGVFSGISTLGSIYAIDPDGDELTFEIVSEPSHGSVYFSDPKLGYYVYTPNEAHTGRDSFSVRAIDKYGAVSNTVKVSVNVEEIDLEEIFSDLNGHWANAAVIACERAGIVDAGEYFYPDEPMSRAEFLELMMNAAGYRDFSTQSTGFSDDASIPEKYKGSVAVADMLGVISGIETDEGLCFCPNNQITRAEAAVIVARLLGIETNDSIATISTDQSVPAWAAPSIEALRADGIMRGTILDGKLSLAPYEVVTRASAAQMAAAILTN